MPFLSKPTACLAAYALLTSLVSAVPVDMSQSLSRRAGSKRMLLWPYANTQDIETNGCSGLGQTAESLASSSDFAGVANWETWRPTEIPNSLPFIPTVSDPNHLSGQNWDNLMSSISGQTNPLVQFYNEPDIQGVDPTQAAADFKSKMVPLRQSHSGLQLVGPSITSDPSHLSWLDTFMSALGGDKPDFLGVHYYTGAGNTADYEVSNAQAYFNQLHSKYGLPLVINEISSTSRDTSNVDGFVKTMAGWMDGQDFIHLYGFTGMSCQVADSFSSPEAQLMTTSGQLNTLGRFVAGKSG
ncbi:glycosyl hydrolase catalytic core-domain-containing protein [Xylariomycetidae sp. FL0641]|nr:glycosyl hydrolase catalytic core-domain-containing protein [Xylariomycetidae sp. FL0641]